MKYYVTLGEKQVLVLAGNAFHACIQALKRFNLEPKNGVDITISTQFRVSQRGFDEHNDGSDLHFPLEAIINGAYLAKEGTFISQEAADRFFSELG